MLTRPPAADRRRAQRQRRRLAQRERLDKLATDKRAYRARLASGGASLKGVPVTDINALIEALLDLHWLPEGESENRKALVAAVGALLDDIAKPYRRVRNGQTDG
jgi:hypothetical protein